MTFDQQELLDLSKLMGFRAEILEKVILLTDLLNAFHEHPLLKNQLVLKGGTALNLFFLGIPRLSIDIDLNYIGSHDRAKMLKARPEIENTIINICTQKDLILDRHPKEHAGGKMSLQYFSVLGNKGRLDIDLNFVLRTPLWHPIVKTSTAIGTYQASYLVLDMHELIAGKLSALFDRSASRDLYDAYRVFNDFQFDMEKLRLAAVIYGGMSGTDWRRISPQAINFNHRELRNQLIPVLHRRDLETMKNNKKWTDQLIVNCKNSLSQIFPLKDNEVEFLNALLDFGEIRPEFITADKKISEILHLHPGLKWKAINVKKRR